MDYLSMVFVAFSAFVFYRIGELELGRGDLSCLASLGISAISIFILHSGGLTILVFQLGLFLVLWKVKKAQ
ncbi:MAG: hypothetical protein HQM08_06330 [Candidatus Riflebacteria bacterium]|nr:hypothetical protein [Candidatus Riflebacteria bacterium]